MVSAKHHLYCYTEEKITYILDDLKVRKLPTNFYFLGELSVLSSLGLFSGQFMELKYTVAGRDILVYALFPR